MNKSGTADTALKTRLPTIYSGVPHLGSPAPPWGAGLPTEGSRAKFLGELRPAATVARDSRLQGGTLCVRSTSLFHSRLLLTAQGVRSRAEAPGALVSSRGHGQPSMVFPSSPPPNSAETPPMPVAGERSAAPEFKTQATGGPLRFKRLPRVAGSGQFADPGFSRKTSGSVPCEARFKSSDRKSLEAAPRVDQDAAGVKTGGLSSTRPRVAPYVKPPVARSEAATTVGARRQPRQFPTHAARRFTKAEAKAEELLDELPPEVLILATGGNQILLDEARELVRCVLLVKGGPEGGTTQTTRV